MGLALVKLQVHLCSIDNQSQATQVQSLNQAAAGAPWQYKQRMRSNQPAQRARAVHDSLALSLISPSGIQPTYLCA